MNFNTRNKNDRTKLEIEALQIAIGEYFTDDPIEIYDTLLEQEDRTPINEIELPNGAEAWQPHEEQDASFFVEHIEILAGNIIAHARRWASEGLI